MRQRSGDGLTLRGGHRLWNSTARVFEEEDTSEDLGWVGGTPEEERDWEDGLEALPRATLRTLSPRSERPEECLPDLDALWDREVGLDRQNPSRQKW